MPIRREHSALVLFCSRIGVASWQEEEEGQREKGVSLTEVPRSYCELVFAK